MITSKISGRHDQALDAIRDRKFPFADRKLAGAAQSVIDAAIQIARLCPVTDATIDIEIEADETSGKISWKITPVVKAAPAPAEPPPADPPKEPVTPPADPPAPVETVGTAGDATPPADAPAAGG